jgi:hypothetical protein
MMVRLSEFHLPMQSEHITAEFCDFISWLWQGVLKTTLLSPRNSGEGI